MQATITRENKIEHVVTVLLSNDAGFQIRITPSGDNGYLIRPTAGYDIVRYDAGAFEIVPKPWTPERHVESLNPEEKE